MARFESRFHSEEIVEDADGTRCLVRVARTGVHRWRPFGGAPNLVAILVTLVRWSRGPRTWSVNVTRTGFFDVNQPPLLDEDFDDRPSAAIRADALVDAVTSGRRPWHSAGPSA